MNHHSAQTLAFTIIFLVLKGGGSTKTTSCVELLTAIMRYVDCLVENHNKKRLKALLIDLDPQETSATTYLGLDQNRAIPNLFHVYKNQVPIQDIIQETAFGFDIIPSNSLLEAIDDALEKEDQLKLREYIEPLRYEYDLIFIDAPPGKRRITISGLLAANLLILPISAETAVLESAGNTINYIQRNLMADDEYAQFISELEIRVLFSKYKKGGNLHAPGVVAKAKQAYSENVLDFYIPDTLEFSRAYGQRTPLTYQKPHHPAAKEYYRLALWVLKNIGYVDDSITIENAS